MNKIFFTADLHFGHKNVFKHCKNRPFAEQNDTVAHDKLLMELWNSAIGKKDVVYILGDLTFLGRDDARRLVEKLNGRKHLIVGNHDGSVEQLTNYFVTISPLKDIVIKPTSYALWSAGIPVNLSSARKLVEIIDETDYVGIQPAYGHKYNTVYDGEVGTYTSLDIERDSGSPNHDAEVIAAAIWEPVEMI